MAYDEKLAQRVRRALGNMEGVGEKKMFGGLCFMLNGNMLCGVEKDMLMLRVGKEAYENALQQPHCRVMDFTGRPLAGYVTVAPAGLGTARALKRWLERGLTFVTTLPPK